MDRLGPDQFVYCNGWTPSSPRHDVFVTDAWDAFADQLPFECHPEMVDQHLFPDFELTLPSGIQTFGEVDLASERLSVIRAKNARYATVCNPAKGPIVIYITVGRRRLRNLMDAAGPVAPSAYFTTLGHLLKFGHAARFLRHDGQQVVLYPMDNSAPNDVPHHGAHPVPNRPHE